MGSVQEKEQVSQSEFAKQVAQAAEEGQDFVPLIGAGLSAASGMPAGPVLHAYLKGCVYLSLEGGHGTGRQGEGAEEGLLDGAWDPSVAKWPPVFKQWRAPVPAWARKTAANLARGKDPSPGVATIHQRALGALAAWDASLDFLARVSWRKGVPKLGPPDHRVIDSFFTHLAAGRKPNAGHAMLAHLAGPLRIQVVLTTNFDDLLEQAFERLLSPLAVFDVHQLAPLPDARLVLAQPSIVKLHGGRYGLRADATLGEEPAARDRDSFARYFEPRDDARAAKAETARKSLLVIGFSGSDPRIMGLLEEACTRGCIRKVYWAAYCKDDVRKLLAQSEYPRLRERLVVTKHHDTALLLLEIYQRACHSLPPAGADFQAFWDVPAEPYTNTNHHFAPNKKRLRAAVRSELKRSVPRVVAADGGGGIASVAAEVYDGLCDEMKCCVWMELGSYYGPRDFFVSLLQAIARKTGVSFMMPRNLASPEDHRQELSYYLARSRSPVLVFLNGRDGFGTCAAADNKSWSVAKRRQLYELLGGIRQRNILFVLLIRTPEREAGRRLLTDEVRAEEIPGRPAWAFVRLSRQRCISFDRQGVLEEVAKWLGPEADDPEREKQRRFVYTMALFRHSRYSAALCSWALRKVPNQQGPGEQVDNDHLCAEEGLAWLKELWERHAIRMMPGGLVWMHENLRKALIRRLENHHGQLRHSWECHQVIADWYGKLFQSLNDPMAALESVYHRLECVNRAADCSDAARWPGRPPLDPETAAHVRETALIEALRMLKAARRRMLACGYFEACEGLIAIVKGVATKLARSHSGPGARMPRVKAFRIRATQLRDACDELLRDIANEAADFDRAGLENTALGLAAPAPPKLSFFHGPSEAKLELQYKGAVYLKGIRAYEEAEETLFSLFDQLHLRDLRAQFRRWSAQTAQRVDLEEVRRMAREWAGHTPRPTDAYLRLAIRSSRRLLFLQMLRAQAEQLGRRGRLDDQPWCGRAQRRLEYAEAAFAMSTEIMRYLDDEAFIQTENAYLRTHYGVMLANLGRFYEAHRRLNEATGYLRHSPKSGDQLCWALIGLRRAEVYLEQARRCEREARAAQDATRVLARLDSSHVALQQAKRRLEGRSREVWWWTWTYELELSICELLSRLPADHRRGCGRDSAAQVCRSCNPAHDEHRVTRSARAEQRLIRLDTLRQARLADLACRFAENVLAGLGSPAADPVLAQELSRLMAGARQSFERVRGGRRNAKGPRLDPLIQKYVRGVRARVFAKE